MPWAGDQALNTLANAYALGEGQVVLDGLVNGMLTYSLWWMVNAAEARRYLGLDDALDELAQGAEDLLERLSARIDLASGVLRGDTSEEPTWVFVDWGYEIVRDALPTALRLLWYWALRCVIALQCEAGGRHLSHAEHWQDVSERVASTLRERGWDAQAGAWADYLDLPGDGQGGAPTAYPQLLAMLSGITRAAGPHEATGSVEGGQTGGVGGVEGSAAAGTVAARLDPSQTHTPFMRGMTLRALHTQGLDERWSLTCARPGERCCTRRPRPSGRSSPAPVPLRGPCTATPSARVCATPGPLARPRCFPRQSSAWNRRRPGGARSASRHRWGT
nr:hypothetical protein [Actinomyces sp.]